MLAFAPIGASPTYDRCGTFAPSPNSAFFVSTNPPIFALRPVFVPGRRNENGPMVDSGPICAPIEWLRSTTAPSPTVVSISVVSGPTTAPAPTLVAPSSCEFWSISASGDRRNEPRDRLPRRREQAEHVGEVLLALVVVGGEFAQRRTEQRRVERIDS